MCVECGWASVVVNGLKMRQCCIEQASPKLDVRGYKANARSTGISRDGLSHQAPCVVELVAVQCVAHSQSHLIGRWAPGVAPPDGKSNASHRCNKHQNQGLTAAHVHINSIINLY